ncbi:hypothetical protein [Halovenus amylolytica]
MASSKKLGHPAFLTGVGTILGYTIILAVLTLIAFGLPYLAFWYF